MTIKLKRIFKHWIYSNKQLKKLFPSTALDKIEAAITYSEARHSGEICIAIESSLSLQATLNGQSLANRALEVFSSLHVWDTDKNNGVLIYLLLAEHGIKITADRNINNKVGNEKWQQICSVMEQNFKAGKFEEGAITGINEVGELLTQHFPISNKSNELSNKPVIL